MAYVELHACSAFSFLRGGSFPEHLAQAAHALQIPAVATLDRNGVYGAQRFAVKARENAVSDGSVHQLADLVKKIGHVKEIIQ